MTRASGSSYNLITRELYQPHRPIRGDVVQDLIENSHYNYRFVAPTYVNDTQRWGDNNGYRLASASQTLMLQYRCRTFPDLDVPLQFWTRALADASGNHTLAAQTRDGATTNGPTTIATITGGGALTSYSGTLTRSSGSVSSSYTSIDILGQRTSGSGSVELKSVNCSLGDIGSPLPAGPRTSGYVSLDTDQAGSTGDTPHSAGLFTDLANNATVLLEQRMGVLDSLCVGVTPHVEQLTTSSTDWTTVRCVLVMVSPLASNIVVHYDAVATNASSTSKVRVIVRPWGGGFIDPTTSAGAVAVPSAAGTTVNQTAVQWTSWTWLCDSESASALLVPVQAGFYEIFYQLKSDGTYDPSLRAAAVWEEWRA